MNRRDAPDVNHRNATTTERHHMTTDVTIVRDLEAQHEDYIEKNYGPLWDEENEAAISVIVAALRAAYDDAGTHEFDRIAGV